MFDLFMTTFVATVLSLSPMSGLKEVRALQGGSSTSRRFEHFKLNLKTFKGHLLYVSSMRQK